MKRALHMTLLGVLAVTVLTVNAASIGDSAPPLTIERWIKGTPVKVGPGENIFVVEFWATWCGPCKRSIPHLSEWQKKYAGKGVIFLGVSDEPVADVAPFVAAQGEAMAYRVATDSSRRSFKSWMTAYGEGGIPHAFIVGTNGAVLWHDFPNENLDRALQRITSWKFDIELAKNLETGDRLVKQYTAMVKKANAAAQAAPLGEKILAEYTKDWRVANHLARAILTDPAVRSRDLALALRATTKATEMTKQHSHDALEMHARALFATGKKQGAIDTQKQALALCNDPEDRQELEKFLAFYEKGAQQPAPKATDRAEPSDLEKSKKL